MLQTKNEFPGNVTLFEKVKEGNNWKVVITRNNKVIKELYCFSENQADLVRGDYINRFWSNKLN